MQTGQFFKRGMALLAAVCLSGCICSSESKTVSAAYTDPNNYEGSDIQRINAAVRDARKTGGIVRIFKRKPDKNSKRDFWLIDSAILLPAKTTLYLMNCKIKLSDLSRDNWIRSANCIVGNPEVKELSDIHIIGEGSAVLEGADRPRSTGDSGKVLGVRTYGTDAGKKGRRQRGDWRNIGILLVKVKNFSIKNLSIIDSHSWAVSLEYCEKGTVRDLHFESQENVVIDGKKVQILNRDGLDLRKGCRNILIENITGQTGDDLIALTAIGNRVRPSGILRSMEFYGGSSKPGSRDVFNITIRNVRGYCAGGHHIIRLLNNSGTKMHHVHISDLLDTSPAGFQSRAAVKIGDLIYGGTSPLGDTSHIWINNIHTNALNAILLGGSLKDSVISNVLVGDPRNEGVVLQHRVVRTRNLFLHNIQTAGKNGTAVKALSTSFDQTVPAPPQPGLLVDQQREKRNKK